MFNKHLRLIVLTILVFSSCTRTSKNDKKSSRDLVPEIASEDKMDWWREAKFGMFIHWGLYAIPAGEHNGKVSERDIGEWIMNELNIPIEEYEGYARMFDPIHYNPEEWVKLAKNAGMKYIVITSKHHDGFGLWDSKISDYDVVDASPYGKDLLKPLAEACEREGIRLCFYYSIMDWHHPDAQAIWEPNYQREKTDTLSSQINPRFPNYLEEYMKPQLKELLTNYGDIGVIWFDGEWIPAYTSAQGREIYDFLMGMKGNLIINNRVDKGRKGMTGFDEEGDFVGDFGTPEQEIPETGLPGVDWEACMTMNDTWGYRKDDHNWKSDTVLIKQLIDVSSKGGNFLLNIGPKADGTIPEPSVERLKGIARWMGKNSEGIHGSSPSPIDAPEWGRITQKNDDWYLFVYDTDKEVLHLNVEGQTFSEAQSLSGIKTPLEVDNNNNLILVMPEELKNELIPVIKLQR